MDPRFRISGLTARLILGIGGFVLFPVPCVVVASALFGAPLDVGGLVDFELHVLFYIGLFLAVVVFLANYLRQAPAPPQFLSPGPARMAGGIWSIADAGQLIAVPNSSQRMHVTFVPDDDFEAVRIRAAVKAVETWVAAQSERAQERGERTNGIATLVELPITLASRASYRRGEAVEWDVAFDLDGQAPPSCGDIDHLGCHWALNISIDRSDGAGARFEQPILVTQPRDRVNSGVLDQPELSRYEQASGSAGPVRVDFRVSPAPLDLAAPAVADVRISNAGVPLTCREVRLEIDVRVKVTVKPAFTAEQIIWAGKRPMSTLPSGETCLRFDIPAINRPWPDVDLPHGWMRGAMRLVVDRPSGPDVYVSRDLCLCLDKPRRAATATTR